MAQKQPKNVYFQSRFLAKSYLGFSSFFNPIVYQPQKRLQLKTGTIRDEMGHANTHSHRLHALHNIRQNQ